MSEEILRNAIKSKNIGNLYLFYGPEEYLKRNYTEYAEKNLLTDEFKLLNKIVMEGKTSPSAIINNCETMPVFSDRKLVVVKNSGLFKKRKNSKEEEQEEEEEEEKREEEVPGKKAKPGKGKQEDELAQFLQNMPGHVCLIFVENEIDKRIKYIDIIKKNGLIVEFDYRKPEKMVSWVLTRVKERNHEIDIKTAAQLVEYCEQCMDDVLNEIDKLCAYAGDRRKITAADIKEVCTKSVKSRIFDLTDAIGAGQSAKALSLLHDMLILKEPIQKIMFMIAKQFRQLLQIKLLQREGATSSQITSRLKLSPYFSGKIIKQSQGFTLEKLEAAISTGLELDISIKSGKMKDRAAVELMIISMSS